MPLGKFKHHFWFFADTPNIARNCRVICMGSRFLPSVSNIGEDVQYNIVVSVKCIMWKVYRSPTLCRYLETIIDLLLLTETGLDD
jgi:hypothetical protein